MTLLGNSNRLLPHLWEIITGSYYISLGNRNKFQSLLWPGEYKQVLATSLGQPRPEKIWFWVFISILTLVQSLQHTHTHACARASKHTRRHMHAHVACTNALTQARAHTHTAFFVCLLDSHLNPSLYLCAQVQSIGISLALADQYRDFCFMLATIELKWSAKKNLSNKLMLSTAKWVSKR